MPFGRHRGAPVRRVPTDYLHWLYRNCKLSSGLRAAVRAELLSRPDGPRGLPPEPASPSPECYRCGGRDVALSWQQLANGARRIRAECRWCRGFVKFMPETPENVAAADATASPTALLDVLTRLEEAGVNLDSDGRRVWVRWEDGRRLPPDLRALIHQCSNSLAKLLGDTRSPARRV
jgi:hypothetical protein